MHYAIYCVYYNTNKKKLYHNIVLFVKYDNDLKKFVIRQSGKISIPT